MARSNAKICPHWAKDDSSCLLSQSGLYLPVAEHIEIYCEGGNFLSCSQYITHAGSDENDVFSQPANQRRYQRIPGRFSFRLAEREQDDVNRIIDDAATTIDLSPGGIRFESYRSLRKGSRVIFSLNGDFSEMPLRGVGLVKWCHSLENAPLYHAGIAFADPGVARAIRKRLGISAD
ncbi:MAG TPA: PilZ domain-containing protein [Desulfobulbaceae bacterium]|nr:PilZ domain-containing protein [Desulfobulbaceae bacterium]